MDDEDGHFSGFNKEFFSPASASVPFILHVYLEQMYDKIKLNKNPFLIICAIIIHIDYVFGQILRWFRSLLASAPRTLNLLPVPMMVPSESGTFSGTKKNTFSEVRK